MGDPVRIKFRSMGEVKDGLSGLAFMEGGSYISDWLRGLPSWAVNCVNVPDKVAKSILSGLGLDYATFGNKDFVRFTDETEKSGMNDREIVCFLYRHDYTWRIQVPRPGAPPSGAPLGASKGGETMPDPQGDVGFYRWMVQMLEAYSRNFVTDSAYNQLHEPWNLGADVSKMAQLFDQLCLDREVY